MEEKPKQRKKRAIIEAENQLLRQLIAGPWQTSTQPMRREEWLASLAGDIDPVKHAGEGWFSTEEYAKPSDIMDPFVRAQVGAEEDYYPETYRRKKK
jgi:hypothetical protein